MSKSDNVRVVVRLRKVPKDKAYASGQSVVVTSPAEKEVQIHSSAAAAAATRSLLGERGGAGVSQLPTSALNGCKRYTFDSLYDEDATQAALFADVGESVVSAALQGYNATVLSYGQTGSGKTYTMLGPDGGSAAVLADPLRAGDLGLVPRILARLFSAAGGDKPKGSASQPSTTTEAAPERDVTVTVGVAELYNEVLRDLCPLGSVSVGTAADASVAAGDVNTTTASTIGPSELRIREDRGPCGRGIYIEGLAHHHVAGTGDAMTIIRAASERKAVGATRMNETSSRSHTIVVVSVSQVDHVHGETRTNAQLFLVDLAGSERVGKTGAAGDRLREAQSINLSLTLLGNVISKLTDGTSVHVPYRDSKLTRLLQDSLGGTALTTLICACTPDPDQTAETTSTLEFARRAKAIRNQPVANIIRSPDEMAKEIAMLQGTVRTLREQLRLSDALAPPSAGPERSGTAGLAAAAVGDNNEDVQALLREVAQLKEELAAALRERDDEREVSAFHRKLEAQARAEAALAKAEALRSKTAADAALEKLQELLRGQTVLGPVAVAVAAPPVADRRDMSAGAALPRRTSVGNGFGPVRGAAVRGGRGIGQSAQRLPSPAPTSTASLSLPTTGASPPVGGASTASAPTGPSGPVSAEISAVRAEAQALVRERVLLTQVDQQKQELDKLRKFAVLADRQQRDMDEMKAQHQSRIEALTARYEEMLRRQEHIIEELRSTAAASTSAPAPAASSPGQPAPGTSPTAKSGSASDEDTATVDASVQHLRDQLAHMELENGELHAENRVNGMRLVDFTKKMDGLETEVRQLRADRETMRRDIEFHDMTDGTLRKKLLAALSKGESDRQSERAYFRKRLLDCFSSE